MPARRRCRRWCGRAPTVREFKVEAGGLRWHVNVATGPGTRLLLVHGTGASVHSWDRLIAALPAHFAPLAMDLPGHGGTSAPRPDQLTLPGMAAALGELLRVAGATPEIAVGHSAGAALLVRMALDGLIAPRAIVAVNGAFMPFGGPLASLFSPMAKMLYTQGWLPRLFAHRAGDRRVVRRMIEGTGSHLDEEGVAAYQRLVQRPAHSAAALGMMAHWDLQPLARELPRLDIPLHLLVGERDVAVPPSQARHVASICPAARVTRLSNVGHLAHEEDPQAVARFLQGLVEAPETRSAPRV